VLIILNVFQVYNSTGDTDLYIKYFGIENQVHFFSQNETYSHEIDPDNSPSAKLHLQCKYFLCLYYLHLIKLLLYI